jgi:hypothetical protein
MAHYPGILTPNHCLDEEFDAADLAADHELCRAIAAGKWGLHPDVWGAHDPLATLPPHFRNYEPPARVVGYDGRPSTTYWRPSVVEKPAPRPKLGRKPRYWSDPPPPPPPPAGPNYVSEGQVWAESDQGGLLQLTCDECGRPFVDTLSYIGGYKVASVAALRASGRKVGWTCIVGRDRCPDCSHAAAPEAVGNGAGEDQGHEQDAQRR